MEKINPPAPEPSDIEEMLSRLVAALKVESPSQIIIDEIEDQRESDNWTTMSPDTREGILWAYGDVAYGLLSARSLQVGTSEDTLELLQEYDQLRNGTE